MNWVCTDLRPTRHVIDHFGDKGSEWWRRYHDYGGGEDDSDDDDDDVVITAIILQLVTCDERFVCIDRRNEEPSAERKDSSWDKGW